MDFATVALVSNIISSKMRRDIPFYVWAIYSKFNKQHLADTKILQDVAFTR